MKTIILMLFLASGGILSLSGQLNTLHNHYRAGDMLIKQQVEFIDPGEEGVNKIWNFSRLRTINDEYSLSYSLPPLEGDSVYILGDKRYLKKKMTDNELIVGTEHNTMYYYRLSNDSLLQYGHENPTVKLGYTYPMVLMYFPLNFGQTTTSYYKSEGLYSGTVDIRTQGTITTTADAYGSIILPSGDTLSPVLRTKTMQTILDIPNEYSYNIDSDNDKGKVLETCRWYSKGYRYPVFETVRNINLADSAVVFSTAFFYPPQDHLYLDTDPENLALLDELWQETENNSQTGTTEPQTGKTVNIDDLINCRIYPNPVESVMNLEYELKQDVRLTFEMYSLEGIPVKKIQTKNLKSGKYYETIDCSGLYPKNYVLRITVNDLIVNEIIIKK